MAKIPNAGDYSPREDNSHPAIADRRAAVEQAQAQAYRAEHMGGRSLDEVLGPERFKELFGD